MDDYVYIVAADLLAEDDSNPEYDRALVEMTMRLTGLPDDRREQVEITIHTLAGRYHPDQERLDG